MISQLKWKLVSLIMAMVSFVLIATLSLNYLTNKVNLQQYVTSALFALIQSDVASEPWKEGRNNSVPFFYIQASRTGQVVVVSDEYYNLSATDLSMIAATILAQTAPNGTVEELNLRYVYQEDSEGFRIICSDLSLETVILEGFFRNSLFLGLCALVVLGGFSVLLANQLVRPVARAMEQQEQFVADASHELKTPLTVILSSAEMLSGHSPSEEASQRWLEHISAEGNRMQRLIEDMLTLTKMQEIPEKTSVDFSEMVQRSILMFEAIAFEQGLFLQDQVEESLVLSGDRDKLQQLLGILLDNALKYSPNDSQVMISLEKEHGKYALLQISNPSEPIEECEKLFNRFYRQDGSRSQKKGYGLGLSIAETIVSAHGGKIWAEYDGACLTILARLPLG